MADQDDTDAGKDVPPWLQPVPETEESGGFFAANRNTVIAAAVAVSLIVIFIAAIVFLYNDAPREGPRHIVAEDAPIRERPEEVGGMQVDHQDKGVLEIGDGTPVASQVQIGEQPEQPVKEIPDLPAESTAPSPDADTIGDLAEAALENEQAPEVSAPESSTAATVATPAPTAVEETPAPQTATSGQFRVQLGAYGSEQSAATAWRTIRAQFINDLGGLEPVYVPVESGDRTLYRLRVGMLATRAAADAVCISLRTQQQACFVVNP